MEFSILGSGSRRSPSDLESKRAVYIRNVKKFLKLYGRSRMGLSGAAIMLFFLLMAALAPYLTPYDPIYSMGLAQFRAKPEWLAKTGNLELPRNMFPITDAGFSESSSVQSWTVAQGSSPSMRVLWDSTEGYPGIRGADVGSGPGSILVEADSSDTPVNDTVTLSYRFDYPYAPMRRFSAHVAYKGQVEGTASYLVQITIGSAGGDQYVLWDSGGQSKNTDWVIPKPPIDSTDASLKIRVFGNVGVEPGRLIFSHPGQYAIGVRVLLRLGQESTLKVFLDDITFRVWGDTFGLLGTDNYGRDILTQLTHGSRLSLMIGTLSAVIAVVFGLLVGLVSGYLGGRTDELLMRVNDILLTIPGLPLLMVLVAVIGPSIWSIVILIGFLGWMGIARLIRSQVLTLKEKTYVEAARALGGGTSHIITRHLVPNVMTMAYTQLALTVPNAIVTEAALSFLGLGDPYVQTWGKMLHDVEYYGAITEWWWAVPPGLCIAFLSLAFVLVGYALDEILNPKLRGR